MIAHIIPAEKFTVDYIERIYRLFPPDQHRFIVYGAKNIEYRVDELGKYEGVCVVGTLFGSERSVKKLLTIAELIICHSLFLKIQDLALLNAVITHYNRNACWVIWGKDLYESYDDAKHATGLQGIKVLYKESLRRKIIGKMCGFVTTGDFDALKERYIIKDNAFVVGAQYTYDLLPINIVKTENHKPVNVMIGHSATRTCRHIETMTKLAKYRNEIKVFCPLSYPNDTEYIKQVSENGHRLFGDNFIPITHFMQYKEYIGFLETIDIGVFNNSRQQGMGNITNLLYLGKKVYLSEDNTIRKSYLKTEYTIFDYTDINSSDFLKLLSEEEAEENRRRIVYKFSDENFKNEWERVFNG